MKIRQNGTLFETDNAFVIEQMLKHGGVEVKTQAKPKEEKAEAKKK